MKKYLAEMFGTFALVLVGTGAIIVDDYSGGAVSHLGVSVAFGLIVTAMIYTFGKLSGAHINPAVSIGFLLNKKLNGRDSVGYVTFQLIGAICASLILKLLFVHDRLGATIPSGTALESFVLELIMTFGLMLSILIVSKYLPALTAIAVGAVVGLEAYFGGPTSGASMNPARSIGPALISGNWQHQWIYVVAPIVGAVLAAILFNTILKNPNPLNHEQA
ncbi:MAG: aquaporin [Flavobacteriales bacterium]